MKRNSTKTTVNSTKSGSPKARNLTCKTAVLPDCRASSPHTPKCTKSRPHSSPCRVYSRSDFENMFRPCSTTDIANPILSFLDIKRILFQKITDKGDELKKAFQLLDPGHNMTVSRSELRRIITTFLVPLTREQFQDVLTQDVFITPKRTASSFAVTPSPAPAPLIYLRSQQRRLFWTSHINGITQYVTFCVWLPPFSIMFSRFIHVVA